MGTAFAALFVVVHPVAAQLPAPPVSAASHFVWGGYASLTVSHPEHVAPGGDAIQVNELAAALMAWGAITPRASYFVEWDAATQTSETWTGRTAQQNLTPVRLYMEYAFSDLFRVRVGRFLTPIGQWNEIHAEPLTWTPLRPLVTYRPFAKSLNGALLAGEGSLDGHDAGYALFWAPGLDFDNDTEAGEESQFIHALGGRVAMEVLPGLYVGLSAASERRSTPRISPDQTTGTSSGGEQEQEIEQEDLTNRTLLGGDLSWTGADVEVMAEATWLARTESQPGEGGAYVVGSFRLRGPLWAVGESEFYTPVDGQRVGLGYAGLTYRSGAHLVVKFGREFATHSSSRVPDGWFLSLSSLF